MPGGLRVLCRRKCDSGLEVDARRETRQIELHQEGAAQATEGHSPPSPPTRAPSSNPDNCSLSFTIVNEMDDEFDHDMLFEFESPVASSGRRDAFLLDAPQLSRQTKHNDVIAQIEAVFETVADALLNERADITVSLAAHSTSSQDDPSTRGPKATFTFPGKNASDAWRFCW